MTNTEFISEYAVYIDRVREYIRDKMANHHPKRITYADLAAKTGYARGTVDNFFDGTTKRPPFEMVCAFVWACGGYVDEAIGLVPPPPPAGPEKIPDSAIEHVAKQFTSELKESHMQTILAKSETISNLQAESSALRVQITAVTRWLRLFVTENILFAVALLVKFLLRG